MKENVVANYNIVYNNYNALSMGFKNRSEKMTSYEIKVEMMKAKVKQYEVAETLGYSEAVFSRKLRKGLSKDEIKQVLEIINKFAKIRGVVENGKN